MSVETINTTIRSASDVTKSGTTTFSDPINVVKNSEPTPQELSQLYPVRDQSISDFLAKPIAILNGQWSTSDTSLTFLETGSIGGALLSQPLWTDKLSGFNFIRATAVFRVVINSTPFHAGILKFGFIPFQGTDLTTPSLQPNWRKSSLASYSTVPGVMIDAKDSTAIIRIPYISTVDYYTIQEADHIDWGTYGLTVYSPLATGAASPQSVSYTIYLHFEDVELAVPVHPQSGARPKSKAFKKVSSFSSKVGDLAKKEIASQEAEIMSSGGSVSRGLMYAGKAVETMSAIPILSSIAAPVSWVLRGASTVASWFGFSKPEIDTALTYVSRNNQPNMANATGVDSSVTLGLFHDNSIEMRPGFGANDMDEMNFDFIKSVPAYHGQFDWSSDTVADTNIAAFKVSPRDLYQQVSAFGTVLRYYPPFAYLATFFQVYRGSIDLHFKIVKTDYHSGKLAFSFVPIDGYPIPNTSDRAYLLREVVDIKDKSELVLRIPYLHYSKYIGVEDSLGTVYVTVINELVAPENCASSVRILQFANAGTDFEYAIPGQSGSLGAYTAPLVPQMGGVELDTNQAVVSEVIGNYPSMPHTNEAACSSIGEKFVSIRQLLLRYTRLASPNDVIPYPSTKTFFFYPWTVALPLASSGYAPQFTYDALSRLAHGFAFMRGSIRIGIVPPKATDSVRMINNTSLSQVGSSVWQNVDYEPNSGATYNLSAAFTTGHSNAETIFDSGIGFPSSRLPYYCENHSTAILPVSASTIPSDVWNSYGGVVVSDTLATTSDPVDIRRSIGEDFSLGYFLGFPPLFNSP